MSKKIRKAQAAMEFFITYGWVIIIVISVIAVLARFGVLSPANILPERCIGGAGFDCLEKASVYSESDTIVFSLKNSLGTDIVISGVMASTDSEDCTGITQALVNTPGFGPLDVNNGGNTVTVDNGDFAVFQCKCDNNVPSGRAKMDLVIEYQSQMSGQQHYDHVEIISKASGSHNLPNTPPPLPSCGDGNYDSGEECDDGPLNGIICTPAYGGRCFYCSATCTVVTVQGGSCGDGIINGPEQCESNSDCGTGKECQNCRCITAGLCGNHHCEAGENCPADNSACTGHTTCYASMACTNGCQPANEINEAEDPGYCDRDGHGCGDDCWCCRGRCDWRPPGPNPYCG